MDDSITKGLRPGAMNGDDGGGNRPNHHGEVRRAGTVRSPLWQATGRRAALGRTMELVENRRFYSWCGFCFWQRIGDRPQLRRSKLPLGKSVGAKLRIGAVASACGH